MTWKEFKDKAEEFGITDETQIAAIKFYPEHGRFIITEVGDKVAILSIVKVKHEI